jgi:hypothetical protein
VATVTPGYSLVMEETGPRSRIDDVADSRPLRRILIAVRLVLAVLILVGVAIYTGAFLILAPMMQ